jgi:hypothetical protein
MDPRCFIAMPITTPADRVADYGGDGDHFAHVLEYLLVPAVNRAGYEPWLATVIGGKVIHSEFVRALRAAELVLVDLSGHNPNVLFELGLRTGRDGPVALVRDEQTELPFDIAILNCHCYSSTLLAWNIDVEIERLAKHLVASAAESAGHNAFWQQFGATGLSRTGEPGPVPKQRNGQPPIPTEIPRLAVA